MSVNAGAGHTLAIIRKLDDSAAAALLLQAEASAQGALEEPLPSDGTGETAESPDETEPPDQTEPSDEAKPSNEAEPSDEAEPTQTAEPTGEAETETSGGDETAAPAGETDSGEAAATDAEHAEETLTGGAQTVDQEENASKAETLDGEALLDESLLGATEADAPADDYRYYAYGWGYDEYGALAQGSKSGSTGGSGGWKTPIQLLRSEASETGGTVEKDSVVDVAGVTGGASYTVYWLTDGAVMASGYNQLHQLGAAEALREKSGSGESMNENLPVRVGFGIGKKLIFNKIWVYTTDEDPDTGESSRTLTGRYAARPDSVSIDPGDEAIAANVSQIPVTKLMDTLPITDRQDAVIFKSGIRRYYSVGFNIVERDRAVATPEGIDIDYSAVEGENAAFVTVENTGADHVTGYNNGLLTPGDSSVANRYGSVDILAAEQISTDSYSGGFDLEIKDANNFTTPTVKAGEGFAVALKSDGSVWAWGDNSYGQLGIGFTAAEVPYTTYPTPVKGLNGTTERLNLIEEISAGFHHALARTSDGSVYAWGDNSRGQLGLGEDATQTAYTYPAQVIAGDSGIYNSGANYLVGAVSIAAGGEHSLALLSSSSDHYVYSWGDNTSGQLGTGYLVGVSGEMRAFPSQVVRDPTLDAPDSRFLTGATMVAAGAKHSLAVGLFAEAVGGVSNATSLAGWGDNTYGQLGFARSVAEDGKVYAFKLDYAKLGEQQSILSGVVQVAAGDYHTVVLTGVGSSCRIRVMGDNSHGQLGENSLAGAETIDYAVTLQDGTGKEISDGLAIAAGKYHTVILRGIRAENENGEDDGTGAILGGKVYAFGDNSDSQLGYQSEGADDQNKTLQEIKISGMEEGSVVTGLSAAGNYSLAINDAGEIFSWGGNESGQLGEFSLVDRTAAGAVGYGGAWIPAVAGVVNYGGSISYHVVIEVQKDHAVYADNGKDYKLILNTPVATEILLTPEGNGRYSGEAKGGSYSVYAKSGGSPDDLWEDTGIDVAVTKGVDFNATPAIVDFFTVSFRLTENRTSGSTISATYNGKIVESGDLVWGGGKLVITTVGMGGKVNDYIYVWTGSGTAEADGAVTETVPRSTEEGADPKVVNGRLTIEKLGDTVNATCTVSGPTTHGVAITIKKDGGAWANSGKKLSLKNNFAVNGFDLTDNGFGVFSAAEIPGGIYTVMDGTYDTGIAVAVTGAYAATLEYFTLDYSVTPIGGIAWAYIHAYYADSENKALKNELIPSGTPALRGAKVVFEATAKELSRLYSTNTKFHWTSSGLIDQNLTTTLYGVGTSVYVVDARAALSTVATCGDTTRTVSLVTLRLDGNYWADSNKKLSVVSTFGSDRAANETAFNNGAVWATYELSEIANGTFEGTVPSDTYQICVDGVPVGGVTVTVTPTSPGDTVKLDYYTVNYSVAMPELDGSTPSTVSEARLLIKTVDGTDPADAGKQTVHADVVLDTATRTASGAVKVPGNGNSALVISLQGTGSAGYTYRWWYTDKDENPAAPVNKFFATDVSAADGVPSVLSTDATLNGVSGAHLNYGGAIELNLSVFGTGTGAVVPFSAERTGEELPIAARQSGQIAAAGNEETSDKENSFTDGEEEPAAMAAEAPAEPAPFELILSTPVEGREPVRWNKDHTYVQEDLLLGNEIELISGDTVDITGTVESFLSNFRLTSNQKDSVSYINTTGGPDGTVQPYVVIPSTDEEGNPLPESPNVKEVSFTITSSNSDIVSVNRYTLTAGDAVGKAVVRVYNTVTGRSAMLTIHVLNVEDYRSDVTRYAYKTTPSISLGGGYSLALKADGSVWAWGDNTWGQLGVNNASMAYSDAPVRVVDAGGAALKDVVAIAAGARHALALARDGVVYAWGSNATGELGANPAELQSSSCAIAIDTAAVKGAVVDVAAGDGFSLFLTEKNTVWGLGRNDKGQLGMGYTNDVVGYDSVRDAFLIDLKKNGTKTDPAPYYLDSLYLYETYLDELQEFIEIQGDPALMQDAQHVDPETGEVLDKVPQFQGNEMPSYDMFLQALELYDAAALWVGEFKPIVYKLEDEARRDTSWTLARPTYSGSKWSYEDYLSAKAAYQARVDSNTNVQVDGQMAESAPTFDNFTYTPRQVVTGASASKGYYLSMAQGPVNPCRGG